MIWKTIAFFAVVAIMGCANAPSTSDNAPTDNVAVQDNNPMPQPPTERKIMLELYPDKAPKTCAQILGLLDKGFYAGQRFHRVEDWVVQWGDPQSKEPNWQQLPVGSKGSGKNMPFEANDIKMAPGTLAMASTGAKVGGDSQMFILTSRCAPEQLSFLQGSYAAFGKVVEGQDVVDSLTVGDVLTMKRVGTPGGPKAPVKVEIDVRTVPQG